MKLYKNLATALRERNQVEALKISINENVLPDSLLDFSNLKELYLEGHCTKLVSSQPHWNKLKICSLRFPNLKDDLTPFFYLPHLENLKIIDTPLKVLHLPLGHVTSPLKSLTIKNSGLSHLPEEFSMLEQLGELNLSGNQLENLPASFAELKKLKRLNLDHNNFKVFPKAISNMPNLIHLSIDSNLFDEEEKARIQREFNIWPN